MECRPTPLATTAVASFQKLMMIRIILYKLLVPSNILRSQFAVHIYGIYGVYSLYVSRYDATRQAQKRGKI